MKNKVQFLNLGKQPITNNFLIKKNPKKEFFYNLKLIFYSKSKLVSLAKFVQPKKCLMKNMLTGPLGQKLCLWHILI